MSNSTKEQELYKTIISLSDEKECRGFFEDLCTPAEIQAMTERWEIARLLNQGELSYREISAKTGASTTTISRVARFLGDDDNQGYRRALEKQA